MLLVLSDKGKGMQSSSELVGEEHCVTTLITAAKETSVTSKHKTKTNSTDIFEELWQTHDDQGIVSFENQDSSVFTEKINRFLNSGKLVSVTDIHRKYSWEFRQLKIVTLS